MEWYNSTKSQYSTCRLYLYMRCKVHSNWNVRQYQTPDRKNAIYFHWNTSHSLSGISQCIKVLVTFIFTCISYFVLFLRRVCNSVLWLDIINSQPRAGWQNWPNRTIDYCWRHARLKIGSDSQIWKSEPIIDVVLRFSSQLSGAELQKTMPLPWQFYWCCR